MTTITIASIETSIGAVMHTVAADAIKVEAIVHTIVMDIDKAAPMVLAILGAVNPAAASAGTVIIDLINAFDKALGGAVTDATAPDTLTLTGVQKLITDYKSAKAQALSFESAL